MRRHWAHDIGSRDVSEFAQRAGLVLRQARRRRGLTLHAVSQLSGGFLRPSTIAGYEHGSRAISLERFFELSKLYGVAPDRLLRDVLQRVASDGKDVVVDLTNLESVPAGAGASLEDDE